MKALQTRKNVRERIKARASTANQASAAPAVFSAATTSMTAAPKLYTISQCPFTQVKATLAVSDPIVKKEDIPAIIMICFDYSQSGHIARDCPLPKRITDIKGMEEAEELIKTDMDHMSGNEEA
jgi:hypothetical protein